MKYKNQTLIRFIEKCFCLRKSERKEIINKLKKVFQEFILFFYQNPILIIPF